MRHGAKRVDLMHHGWNIPKVLFFNSVSLFHESFGGLYQDIYNQGLNGDQSRRVSPKYIFHERGKMSTFLSESLQTFDGSV